MKETQQKWTFFLPLKKSETEKNEEHHIVRAEEDRDLCSKWKCDLLRKVDLYLCRTLSPGRLPLCRLASLIWFSRLPGEKERWPTSLLFLHGTVTWGFPWWVHSFFDALDQSRIRYTKRFSHWAHWCGVTAMIDSETVGGRRAEAGAPSFVNSRVLWLTLGDQLLLSTHRLWHHSRAIL